MEQPSIDIGGFVKPYSDNIEDLVFIVEDRSPIVVITEGNMRINYPKAGFMSKEEWTDFKRAEKALSTLVNPTKKDVDGFARCFIHKWPKDGEEKCWRQMIWLLAKQDGDPVYESFAIELGRITYKEIAIEYGDIDN